MREKQSSESSHTAPNLRNCDWNVFCQYEQRIIVRTKRQLLTRLQLGVFVLAFQVTLTMRAQFALVNVADITNTIQGNVTSIAVKGNYAYIATADSYGLRIYEV